MTLHEDLWHEPDARSEPAGRRYIRVPRGYLVALVALAVLTSGVAILNIALSRRAAAPAQAQNVDQEREQAPVAPKEADTARAEPTTEATTPEQDRGSAPREGEVSAMAKQVEPSPPVAATPAPPPARENRQPSAQTPTESRPIAPSARVAQWMADTYGKTEAERRIAEAMAMYPAGDDRLVHWREVLGHLRVMADR